MTSFGSSLHPLDPLRRGAQLVIGHAELRLEREVGVAKLPQPLGARPGLGELPLQLAPRGVRRSLRLDEEPKLLRLSSSSEAKDLAPIRLTGRVQKLQHPATDPERSERSMSVSSLGTGLEFTRAE